MGKNNYIDRLKLPDIAKAAEAIGLTCSSGSFYE